jgi:hypothetical protein
LRPTCCRHLERSQLHFVLRSTIVLQPLHQAQPWCFCLVLCCCCSTHWPPSAPGAAGAGSCSRPAAAAVADTYTPCERLGATSQLEQAARGNSAMYACKSEF